MNSLLESISKNWLLLAVVLLFLLVVIFRLDRNSNRRKKKKFSFRGGTIACGNIAFGNKTQSLKENEWHKLLQKEITRLVDGVILFNPPSIMRVGVTERIETRISKEIYANLRKSLKGAGFPQMERIKISDLMKVRLAGKEFDILALNDDAQIIPDKGFSEWAWDVTPEKSGTKKLHLQVTLRIRLPYGEEKKDYPVIDRDIYVQVNPIYSIKIFIVKYWQWIASTLMLPLAVWAWKTYSK